MARSTFVLAAFCLAGCGYGFSAGVGRLPAGAERIFVRPLENRTTDAEAGALVAAALRQELARRGADGDAGAPARIEGAVLASTFSPSSGTTYVLTLQVEVRLASGERQIAESRRSRQEVYLAGTDPLENEGRRRTALRRAAAALARDLIESFEIP
jgi:hypothetical protein